MTVFTGTSAADSFIGSNGTADSFRFSITNLSAADTVTGGAGGVIDELVITTMGTLLPRAWRGVSGIERLIFDAPGSDVQLTDARLSANNDGGRLMIVGSTGSDKINASDLSAAFAISFTARDGDDTFTGGRGGDNVIVGSAQLTSLDHFAGKRGFDTLTISSGNVIASQLTGVTGFEKIVLSQAGSLTIDNAFAAANEAGRLLTLSGSSRGDTIDAHTLAHAHSLAISGFAGNDRLFGGAGNDSILGGAGNDTIKGGAGNDTIAGEDGSDVLTGGRGDDLVTIAGDFGDYTLSRLPDGRLRIADDSGHADILAKDIERLSFNDRAFELKAPAAPAVTAISDDTGSSSADFVTSDPSLVISGTADPNMTITVFVDGVEVGTAQSDGAGLWSFNYTAVNLSEGSHQLSAKATSEVLTTSAASPTVELVVDTDTGAPTLALQAQSDSGMQGDGVTSDATPTFAGHAEANATIEIFDGATSLGNATANGSGDWTFTSSTLSEGSHSISAVATDVAGNTSSASGSLDLTIDPHVVFDLAQMFESGEFVFLGNDDEHAGCSVAGLGDIDGDGIADIAIGALANGEDSGAVYVVFGSSAEFELGDEDDGPIDLASLDPACGFIIRGAADSDKAGFSVAAAGDVNGDGFADIIVGAPQNGDGGSYAGAAYVIFGTDSGFGEEVDGQREISLADLSPTQGFIIQGYGGTFAGSSVPSAGDVNGDGLDDIVIGAPRGSGGGSWAGESYVVFGSLSGFGDLVAGRQVIDVTALTADQGFVLQASQQYGNAGFSVSSAGDINGDGFDDLIIGAPDKDPSEDNGAGRAYVVFGSDQGFGASDGTRQIIDLGNMSSDEGFVIAGAGVMHAGWSVAGASDLNGDGFSDMLIGAPRDGTSGSGAGECYVIFGSDDGFDSTIDLDDLDSGAGLMLSAQIAEDLAGASVAAAGDVNGDGFGDLIVGAPQSDSQAGRVYVVFGSADLATADIDLSDLGAAQGFMVAGAEAGDLAGFAVSAAGDVNDDGYDDLLVGAHNAGTGSAGAAYVLLGRDFDEFA